MPTGRVSCVAQICSNYQRAREKWNLAGYDRWQGPSSIQTTISVRLSPLQLFHVACRCRKTSQPFRVPATLILWDKPWTWLGSKTYSNNLGLKNTCLRDRQICPKPVDLTQRLYSKTSNVCAILGCTKLGRSVRMVPIKLCYCLLTSSSSTSALLLAIMRINISLLSLLSLPSLLSLAYYHIRISYYKCYFNFDLTMI